jgi:ABC-type multidrug transport system fused ATPase/permease subunit
MEETLSGERVVLAFSSQDRVLKDFDEANNSVREIATRANSYAFVIMPIIFLAGLFFPLSVYPESVLPYIKALPTTALFDGARVALLAGKVDWAYLLILIVSAIISFILAVRVFEKRCTDKQRMEPFFPFPNLSRDVFSPDVLGIGSRNLHGDILDKGLKILSLRHKIGLAIDFD